MAEIAVLGLGNWGTALANHLAWKGHDVLGWSIDDGVPEAINTKHKNPLYLSDFELNPKLKATSVLHDAASRPVLVLVVPSGALQELVPKLELQQKTLVVSAVKGIDPASLKTPLQIIDQFYPKHSRKAVLSGPSFAKDVVQRKPCGVVCAAQDEAVAKEAADLFSSEWAKVYTSTDPIGVELGGILKNVIALAAGMSDGLNLGDSARAGLITRGLAEMVRLATAMGAHPRTLFGLSGLGDLVMTASVDQSRYRTVGLRLGKGEKLEAIVASLGSTAEGVKTAEPVLRLAREHGIEMPITEHISRLLKGEITAVEGMKALMSRPMKAEF